jgi:fucose permease
MTAATPMERQTDRHEAWRESLLLAVAFLGFISLGLPDTISGIAWPSVRTTFSLSQRGFGLVFIFMGCGYCTSSFLGGRLTQVWGVGTLLTVSSLFVVAAMFGFALAPSWPVFLLCSVVWGTGSGGIDSALNAYASTYFSARHMNWLHGCYSIGATLGPLMMTAMLMVAQSWRLGYALVGSVILILSIIFAVTRRWWKTPPPPSEHESLDPVSIRETLREPLVWISLAVFFLYTGLEFTFGQWCFTLLTESRGIHTETAGLFTGVYFGSIGMGRILLGAIVDRVGLDRLVRCSILVAFLGTCVFAFGTTAEVCFAGIFLIGIGMAPVFPCMMSGTPLRLGPRMATHAIGFQVSAAMFGVAVIPTSAGIAAQSFGLEIVAKSSVVLAALLFGAHELLVSRSLRLRPESS